jgi:hypothetical protein
MHAVRLDNANKDFHDAHEGKIHMKSAQIQTFCARTLLTLVVLGFSLGCNSNEPKVASVPVVPLKADPNSKVVKRGVLAAEQQSRIYEISNRVNNTGKLTDEDLSYAIEQMSSAQSSSTDPAYVRMWAAASILSAKSLKPEQKARLEPVAKKLLASGDVRDQDGGIRLALLLDSPKFVNDAKPLLTASEKMPQVRDMARKYLAKHDAQP